MANSFCFVFFSSIHKSYILLSLSYLLIHAAKLPITGDVTRERDEINRKYALRLREPKASQSEREKKLFFWQRFNACYLLIAN